MTIFDFFSHISSILTSNRSVVCLSYEASQPLFFDKIQQYVEKKMDCPLKKLSLEGSVLDLTMQLSTTFLGQSHWFIITNIDSIQAGKKKSDFIQFLKNYAGPHRILLFLPQDDVGVDFHSESMYVIAPRYTHDEAKKITLLYEDAKPELMAYFYRKMYTLKKEYSLDELCLLKEYALLVGNNSAQFIDEWIEKLIQSDVSLFHVSQLFYEKNSTEFFVKWDKVRNVYSDQFWTAFFSEQLFKGYFYIQHKGMVPPEQKIITFGLSFSFLKYDWKLFSKTELQRAHQKIYEIDLSLKRSGSIYQLDTFFMSFFNGDFV